MKNEKDLLQAIAWLCHINVKELEGKTQPEIVDNYILPLAVKPYQEREGMISRNFMQFMATYGGYCLEKDASSGELLLEIAMQRISQGAIMHGYYNLRGALPRKYRQYTAAEDVAGFLDQACWDFLRNNLAVCCSIRFNALWRAHAYKILKGLMLSFNYDGQTYVKDAKKIKTVPGSVHKGYSFVGCLVDASPREIYCFAENLSVCLVSKIHIAEALAPVWEENLHFFKRYESERLYTKISNSSEMGKSCFPSWQVFCMKMLGILGIVMRRKAAQRIRAYSY